MTSTFEDIAAEISEGTPPAWLATMLRHWAPSLTLDQGVHAIQPTKAQMRRNLLEIAQSAATLQRYLHNTSVREFLEKVGAIRIENIGTLDHTLRHIHERAILATKSMAGMGRGKALPADAISPKAFCALIIAEIWKHLHGDYPPPRNLKAARAADAYWRASGGTTNSWGKEPLTGWSHHFRKAKSAAVETMRKEIRRHCAEYSK